MLYVVKFKGCQRCGGDLFLERDSDGVYISCLQCGAIYTKRTEEERKYINKVPASLGTGRHQYRRRQVYSKSR